MDWKFLFDVLSAGGFYERWIDWIKMGLFLVNLFFGEWSGRDEVCLQEEFETR